MADIFISYKSEERPRVAPLARVIETHGFTVWWDLELVAGQKWPKKIKAELDAARCVVVVWTRASVASDRTYATDWIENEAGEGHRRHILVPALLDSGSVPWTHQQVQYANLVGWIDDPGDARLADLIRGVSQHAGERAVPDSAELAAWAVAERAKTATGYRAFLADRPESRFADVARARAAELDEFEAWSAVDSAPTVAALAAFLRRYPAGRFADRAEARIGTLDLSPSRAAAAPGPHGPMVSGPQPGAGASEQEVSRATWALIEASTDPRDYADFMEVYARTPLAFEARRRQRHLDDWSRIEKSDLAAVAAFVDSGPFDALRRVAQAVKDSLPQPETRTPPPAASATVKRKAPRRTQGADGDTAPRAGVGDVVTVVLESPGDRKIDVIKAVRHLRPEFGLAEAKDLVEGPPQPVVSGVSSEEADAVRARLEGAGAIVRIVAGRSGAARGRRVRATPIKPAPPAMTAAQIIREALRPHVGMDQLKTAPDIPERMMANARKKAGIPDAAQILGMFDMTVFGNGNDCIVFTDRGLYSNYISATRHVDLNLLAAGPVEAGFGKVRVGPFKIDVAVVRTEGAVRVIKSVSDALKAALRP